MGRFFRDTGFISLWTRNLRAILVIILFKQMSRIFYPSAK